MDLTCRPGTPAAVPVCGRLFALLEEQLKLNPSFVRLFKMFFAFVFLWHWVGCLWLFIYQLELDDGNVVTEGEDRNIWVPPSYIVEGTQFHQWMHAFYWAMAVTLGIGMDIYPHTYPHGRVKPSTS